MYILSIEIILNVYFVYICAVKTNKHIMYMKLRVKEICNQKGITQKALSQKLGIAEISLSRSINGNPTVETLQNIADALGVEVWEFFTESRDKGEMYGLIQYNGQTYKIDSVDALRSLLREVEAESDGNN